MYAGKRATDDLPPHDDEGPIVQQEAPLPNKTESVKREKRSTETCEVIELDIFIDYTVWEL